MSIIIKDKKTAKKLNTLAREQMKMKLLNDILLDMEICKIEGWDILEFLNDINEMISDILKKQ